MLPYHLGVLDSLKYNRFLDESTPIAGASAGAIAVATHACSLNSKLILDDTIAISDTCRELGRARGNLLPLLREKLEHHVDEDRFQNFLDRTGEAVVSHYELLPSFGPVHELEFEQKEDFINAVCHSSAFPFFSMNGPVILDYSSSNPATLVLGGRKLTLQMPRLVLDGFFAAPGGRFGCPDFASAGVDVDRGISVLPFPREAIGLSKSLPEENCICPELIDDGIQQSAELLRMATQPSPASKLMSLYEAGYSDGDKWCQKEEIRSRKLAEAARKAARL